MKNLFMDGHLSDAAMRALLNQELDDENTLQAIGHIADCKRCAARFADLAEKRPTQPPRGLGEATVAYIDAKMRTKKRELYRFASQIAACAAVIIGLTVFGITRLPDSTIKQQSTPAPAAITVPDPIITDVPLPPISEIPAPKTMEVPEPKEKTSLLTEIGNFIKNLPHITKPEENDHD